MPLLDVSDDVAILARFEELALSAGAAIMDVYRSGLTVETKADSSPVTEADRRAEALILEGVRASLPSIPCVAEEEASSGILPVDIGHAFILIDPLDGTKEFINRHDDFTVNIALVRSGIPEIGVVYAPARGALYSGYPGKAFHVRVNADHTAVERREISARACPTTKTIVASRSHRTPETDAFIREQGDTRVVTVGSSLKFCLLAEGEADIYPRFGPTMEWDTAAGDAVLRAAGGRMRQIDGGDFVYGKRSRPNVADFSNPWFVAEGAVAS